MRKDSPVNACLPCRIVEAVEYVQKHRPDVASRRPIHLVVLGVFTVGLANVCHLERVPSAPNCKCEHQQRYPREYCPCGPAKSSVVQRKAKDGSADDLRNPVEHVVERSRADVEVREVHCIELVGVKPVGCEEHWEKKQDVGVGKEGLPQPQNLRLPCRILLQDNPRFVRSYYMFRVD